MDEDRSRWKQDCRYKKMGGGEAAEICKGLVHPFLIASKPLGYPKSRIFHKRLLILAGLSHLNKQSEHMDLWHKLNIRRNIRLQKITSKAGRSPPLLPVLVCNLHAHGLVCTGEHIVVQ